MSDGAFATLGLHNSYCETVAALGFTEPSDIQREAIPQVLATKDILGIAQTGTGKTAAFGLPLLQNLVEEAARNKGEMRAKPRHPRSLILAPTRELALQIHGELERLGGDSNMKYVCIIGGVNQNPQVKKLRGGVDILVAAPGRLLDLMNQGHVSLSETRFLVLDECDRLLDMGFIPDVRRIISALPQERQTLLFSATMPEEISKLAKEILRDPVRIDVSPEEITVAKIDQRVIHTATKHKRAVLEHLLRDKGVVRAIVFTRTKHGANKVARQLNASGFVAEVIHGNKTQAARQRALENFKTGDAWILVATDIAARGIDIREVSHVINYELPHEPESYVHRIGRTARAGAGGVAWALVDAAEVSRLKAIQRLTKLQLQPVTLDIELPEIQTDPVQSQPARQNTASKGSRANRNGNESGGKRQRSRRRKATTEAARQANGNKVSGNRAEPEDWADKPEVNGNRPGVSNANVDPFADQRQSNGRRKYHNAGGVDGGNRPPKRRKRSRGRGRPDSSPR
jgi:ATP-dependent RNA helicase RhlE